MSGSRYLKPPALPEVADCQAAKVWRRKAVLQFSIRLYAGFRFLEFMVPDKIIVHYNQHEKREVETNDWLPTGKVTAGITAGTSCPNNLIEETIRRLFELRGISVQELLTN